MTDDRMQEFAARGGRWWAMHTPSSRVALLNSGFTRATAAIIEEPLGHGYGFVIDVYPDEARRYQRNLKRAFGGPVELLGSFATPAEAYARLGVASCPAPA
jgi:hypothetical protein